MEPIQALAPGLSSQRGKPMDTKRLLPRGRCCDPGRAECAVCLHSPHRSPGGVVHSARQEGASWNSPACHAGRVNSRVGFSHWRSAFGRRWWDFRRSEQVFRGVLCFSCSSLLNCWSLSTSLPFSPVCGFQEWLESLGKAGLFACIHSPVYV